MYAHIYSSKETMPKQKKSQEITLVKSVTPCTPGLCPKCRKGKHWVNKCKLVTDVEGKMLPNHLRNKAQNSSTPAHKMEGVVIALFGE